MLEISSAAACDTAIFAVARLPSLPAAPWWWWWSWWCCCCGGRPIVHAVSRNGVPAVDDVSERQGGADRKNASQAGKLVAASSRRAAEDRANEGVDICRPVWVN